jgi:hypothetical protein
MKEKTRGGYRGPKVSEKTFGQLPISVTNGRKSTAFQCHLRHPLRGDSLAQAGDFIAAPALPPSEGGQR